MVGRGGFASVYRARQPAFDRDVAIKVLTQSITDEARMRFERECVAIGGLSGHPNIVTVYEHGMTPDGSAYIVMEFLDGGSLADRVSRSGPLPWTTVCEIGVKLAGALESAHRRSVLHRDLKPDNVLVSRFDEFKLGDFGIARVTGRDVTAEGFITATPAHAPPEILSGGDPKVASDVYSLASTPRTSSEVWHPSPVRVRTTCWRCSFASPTRPCRTSDRSVRPTPFAR